jgi:hypothetical protein
MANCARFFHELARNAAAQIGNIYAFRIAAIAVSFRGLEAEAMRRALCSERDALIRSSNEKLQAEKAEQVQRLATKPRPKHFASKAKTFRVQATPGSIWKKAAMQITRRPAKRLPERAALLRLRPCLKRLQL